MDKTLIDKVSVVVNKYQESYQPRCFETIAELMCDIKKIHKELSEIIKCSNDPKDDELVSITVNPNPYLSDKSFFILIKIEDCSWAITVNYGD